MRTEEIATYYKRNSGSDIDTIKSEDLDYFDK